MCMCPFINGLAQWFLSCRYWSFLLNIASQLMLEEKIKTMRLFPLIDLFFVHYRGYGLIILMVKCTAVNTFTLNAYIQNFIWWCWSYHARIGTQTDAGSNWCNFDVIILATVPELSSYCKCNRISFIEQTFEMFIRDFFLPKSFVLWCIDTLVYLCQDYNTSQDVWQAQIHV